MNRRHTSGHGGAEVDEGFQTWTWVVLVVMVAGVAVTGATLPAATARDDDLDRVEDAGPMAADRTVVHGVDGQLLPPSSYPGDLPVFEQRYVADSKAWEPTLGIGPDGEAYFMGAGEYVPETGVYEVDQLQADRPQVWRSTDDGVTWQDVSPRLLESDLLPDDVTALTATPAQSGDPFLHVDPATGWVFNYHQQAYVLCDFWAGSSTDGASWDQWDTCQGSLLRDESWGDHPSITTGPPRAHETQGYPNVLYFCASNGCRSSFDAGTTWTDPVRTTECGVHQLGHLTTGPDGTVYLPHKDCGGAQLGISEDDGLTWRTVMVDDTVWTESVEDWEGWDHDGSVAADAEGNLYYLWLGEDRLAYLAVSTDGGDTWTEPMLVARPDVTYSLFPHVVAGEEGRIAFMYWGTTVESGEREDPDAVWRLYVGLSLDALDASPVFATTTAHDPDDPVHRGPCYLWRCNAAPGPAGYLPPNATDGTPYEGWPPPGLLTEGVYDFLDLEVNPATGDVWLSLVDLCNDACAQPDGTADDPGLSRGAVGVQTGGTRLVP